MTSFAIVFTSVRSNIADGDGERTKSYFRFYFTISFFIAFMSITSNDLPRIQFTCFFFRLLFAEIAQLARNNEQQSNQIGAITSICATRACCC